MLYSIKRQILPVLNALGPLIVFTGLAMLLPIAIGYRENENTIYNFGISSLICIGSGGAIWLLTRRFRRELETRDGFLLVTLCWLSVALFSSIPFLLLLPEISYHRIFFETISCLTTTGATALVGLENLPLSINYWRSLLSWLGGMGIIVLAVAILPLLGVGGTQIFKAENTNLFKDTKLTPRIADTAKALYSIYILASICCAIAYRWAGMSWDDAVLFTFTTMSLSGIAPYDQSVGVFNSLPIEMVTVIFCVFSGFNFSLHFTAWRQRSVWSYFTDVEARAWLLILGFGTALVFGVLTLHHTYPTWEATLRYSVFHVASIFSTTGYSTADYSTWPCSLAFILLFISLFASCSGSTGGGVKMIRVLVLVKRGLLTLDTLLRPRDYLPLKVGNTPIPEQLANTVYAFFALHLMVMVSATFVILLSGVGFTEAVSTVIACISNTGPGLGSVGPASNYAACNPTHLWVGSFCMFVGRLELFSVFVLFTKAFWRS